MIIECALIRSELTAPWFLERRDTPSLDGIRRVGNYPFIISKEGVMLLKRSRALEGIGIMNGAGVANRVITNEEVVWQRDDLDMDIVNYQV